MDNSVDEFFTETVPISAAGQKASWSFFAQKIKCTQNRQLQRVENRSTKWLAHDSRNQPIVHKRLALSL
ncbi:hypothetical protein [Pseudomonas palleroniana]